MTNLIEPTGTYRDFDLFLRVKPAHDCLLVRPCKFGSDSCVPCGGGSHGRGSVSMWWVLRKDRLAVQFSVYTGWVLPATEDALDVEPSRPLAYTPGYSHHYKPMATDLGYHSLTPKYEGQHNMECDLFPQGQCFYDGSSFNAEDPWRIFRAVGLDALLAYLATYWQELASREVTA